MPTGALNSNIIFWLSDDWLYKQQSVKLSDAIATDRLLLLVLFIAREHGPDM